MLTETGILFSLCPRVGRHRDRDRYRHRLGNGVATAIAIPRPIPHGGEDSNS
jgi:hypothetical protein